MVWVTAAIIGGTALVGGLAKAYEANKAADAQTASAQLAANTAQQQYETTRSDLAPYRGYGAEAGNQLNARLPELTTPINMDQATLEKTPGYQFNLTQGLKAVNNLAASKGQTFSGAQLKGAANFATGLADNTYQNQFNNANTNQTNAFNRLKSLVDVGENASAQTGTFGANAANTIAGAQIGAGNAQAAAANATGSALSGGANNIAGYALYKGLYGGNKQDSAGWGIG